ncbi:substrate-binding domain-containing protein [Pseudonocardia humida]|uniref:Substrate-binding domain-containing protein n=1 Tax=Pseudonocardia humida TaxID=2800819 RepID=A0ABT0ZZG9_9PSEU|nr:substrate-binding domain-containing protein [Pseudonocardia humida]MCO1655999.1 substrate-binding domain-containing protein [Pseudonocardia humida]
MGRHRAQRPAGAVRSGLFALVVVGSAVAVGAVLMPDGATTGAIGVAANSVECTQALRVTAATSFVPALDALAPALATGPDCVVLDVLPADGRTAAQRAAEYDADLWIPDDGAWTGRPAGLQPASALDAHPGATIAVSPFYLVADPATADRLSAAGGWAGLTGLLGAGQVSMAIRDPAGSGDGLLPAGAVGEAVRTAGPLAATAALADAAPAVRTVSGTAAALPSGPGEVGAVPEYALLPAVRDGSTNGLRVVATADHTSALRYTWVPMAEAVADPARAARLDRLWEALTGPGSSGALAAAGLRRPGIGLPPGSRPGELPPATAPLFDVLEPQRVDQVFATWYWHDRRVDVLAVVDVSGSMGALADDGGRPLADTAREGVGDIAAMLPDDARLGLWEFGADLAPPLDHRVLLERADLGAEQRAALAAELAALQPRRTGSGLHDTVLAAYTAARDGHRNGVPDHVLVITDGRDEADPGALSAEQLAEHLRVRADPERPVQLTIVTVGAQADATRLAAALTPVGGRVEHVSGPGEIRAAFLHAAAADARG